MAWHLGVDENGLGPQLGPLIVTGVWGEVSAQAQQLLANNPSAFVHGRLADSKQVVAHGRMSIAEAWARVLCEDILHETVATPEQLLRVLSLDPEAELTHACPAQTRAQCWRPWTRSWHAKETHLVTARKDINRLQQLGVRITGVQSAMVCVRRINEGRRHGHSRLDLDLHAMERLIVHARENAGADIVASCGKVGGLQRYEKKFTVLDGYPTTVVSEQRHLSVYRVAGVGEVRFLQDAENQHPFIALASLVGKAVRELWMDKIVDFYQARLPDLPRASGYNDPVSDRFVHLTRELRTNLKIDELCFRREQGKKKR